MINDNTKKHSTSKDIERRSLLAGKEKMLCFSARRKLDSTNYPCNW